MLSIGLTGGIGSGKSLVTKIFNFNWNIPIYYADDRAKWLMQNNPELIEKITNLLGNKAYHNNLLNKEFIASKIFYNIEIKLKLESFVHKAVIEDYKKWFNQQSSKYVLHEAALIFESKLQHNFAKIITVVSPLELRLKRLAERGINNDKAKQIISMQTDDEYKIKLSDFVIFNDEKKSILEQIINIHKSLIHEMG